MGFELLERVTQTIKVQNMNYQKTRTIRTYTVLETPKVEYFVYFSNFSSNFFTSIYETNKNRHAESEF